MLRLPPQMPRRGPGECTGDLPGGVARTLGQAGGGWNPLRLHRQVAQRLSPSWGFCQPGERGAGTSSTSWKLERGSPQTL